MIKKTKYIITSTRVDKHGDRMAKSALESMLPFINGKRKPRLGLEHIKTFPPFGVIMNGEIIQRENDLEHFYLTADMVYFDKNETYELEDGTKLHKEYFSDGVYPFVECKFQEVQKISIATDSTNFESREELAKMNKDLADESNLEIDFESFGRKSELPDPETIITITETIAITLGIIKSKIPEKIGEAIGEDLVKFYRLVSKLAIETIKRTIPANRPNNFIISYPNSESEIELVITTTKADEVLKAITTDKLQEVSSKIEQLENLNPEKIQFIFGENGVWEFNYLLSKDGSVVGTKKSFNKRNKLYNKILDKQNGKAAANNR